MSSAFNKGWWQTTVAKYVAEGKTLCYAKAPRGTVKVDLDDPSHLFSAGSVDKSPTRPRYYAFDSVEQRAAFLKHWPQATECENPAP